MCNCTTIPKSKKTKIKKIVLYLDAPEEELPYILKSIKELQEAYLSLNNKAAPSSWGSKKLIEMLISKKKYVGRAIKNKIKF